MEFKKFNSLENTYRGAFIDRIKQEGLSDGLWIVTSKLHGANFSFWCDGDAVKVGSRSQFVDGTFYGSQQVINKHEEEFLRYHREHFKKGQIVVIYGELFGNGIQKGVKYGEKRFNAFDVVVDGEILLKQNAYDLATVAGFEWVPVLFCGSFEECMNVSCEYKSLYTPEDHVGDNWEEGIVIEPNKPQFLSNEKRVYLKKKHPSFSEKKNSPKNPSPKIEFNTEQQEAFDEVCSYINKNRIDAAISKFGCITTKDFGKISGMVIKDIIEEYEKYAVEDNNGNPLKVLFGEIWATFNREITKVVGAELRPVFVELLEE